MTSLVSKINYREKKFIYSVASSLLTKGINIFVSLVSLPLILNSIGKERYGMMLTITSISALISFADLGLGFGLQSQIPALAKKRDNSLQKTISSTFYFLVITSIIILTGFFLFTGNINWTSILKLQSEVAINEAYICVVLFALSIVLVIPFSVVQKLQIGLQEGYLSNFWITSGNVVSVLCLYFFYKSGNSTPNVILSIYGVNALFIFLNFIHQFFFKKRYLFPKIRLVEFSIIKTIVQDSSLFFLVQMLGLLIFISNNSFLIYHHSPEVVTEFNIAYKLAVLFLLPLEAAAPYITPAMNEALVSGDTAWIKKSTKRVLLLTVSFAIVSSGLTYLTGDYILTIWLGKNIVISKSTLLAIAAFIMFYSSVGSILSYIMLSSSFIKQKAMIYTFAVVVTLVVKYYMIRTFAVEGAFWSTTIPMFFLYIIPCIALLKRRKLI